MYFFNILNFLLRKNCNEIINGGDSYCSPKKSLLKYEEGSKRSPKYFLRNTLKLRYTFKENWNLGKLEN